MVIRSRQRGYSYISETSKQLSEGFISLGNMAAGSLIFGQAFLDRKIDILIGFCGVIALIFLYAFAILLLNKHD